MTIIQYLSTYLTALAVFIVIDGLWLGVIAKDFYRTHLGALMGEVQWPPAILFYLLYIVGIVLFAVLPALEAQSALRALALGATFGVIAYATYDLTNQAVLKDWPPIVTLVDIVWGGILTGVVSFSTYLIAVRILL